MSPTTHRCRCRTCAPEAFPPASQGEGCVRADDQLRDGWYYRAWLDGVEIEDGCLEAMTGRRRRALVGRGHRCACGGEECAAAGWGEVVVQGRPTERP